MENELAVYDEFIQQLKQFQASDAELVFDVETPDGEADCRAYHKKLRKVWNRVNDLRLDTSKIYREKVDNINAEGNGILAEIDAIANPRKALLDAKEAKIQKEIDAKAAAAEKETADIEAKRIKDLEEREAKAQAIIDADAQAKRDKKADADRVQREKQIEFDKLAAVEQAKAKAEQDAKDAAKKVIHDANELAKQVAYDAAEAHKQAEQDKLDAIAEQKAIAHQKENDRIAKDLAEKNKQDEIDRKEAERVADVEHQTNIHLEITESLSGYTRNAANADMLMAAIVDGRVPHIQIVY